MGAWDALMPDTATAGSRLYNQAGVDSTAVKLLIHGDVGSGQSFTDSSLSNHTITAVGDVTHSTTQSKFSGGSIKFDGTGDYLSVADSSDLELGSTFTIDFWVYLNSISADYIVADHRANTQNNGGWSFYTDVSAGGLGFDYSNGTTWAAGLQDPTVNVIDNWYHYAIVQDGSNIYMYRNGVQVDTSATLMDDTSGTYTNLFIGGGYNSGGSHSNNYYMNGYLDEIRITKGVALWTQNFAPPARRDTLMAEGVMYNGTCLDFDGLNDYVDCGTELGTNFGDNYTDGFSVSLWFKCDVAAAGLFNISSFSGSYGALSLYISGSELIFRIASDVTTKVAMASTNIWHHVVGTYDGSTIKKIYLDGVLADSDAYTAAIDFSGLRTVIAGFYSNAYTMDGSVANTKIFNVELNASQVKELYDDSRVIVPSTISPTNLKGWWPMNEGVGLVCYDGSGNGHHGTQTNMDSSDWLTGQTGSPQLVEGYNRPMLFDGSSDYVTGNDGGFPSGNSARTISAWVYPSSVSVVNSTIFGYGTVASYQGWGLDLDSNQLNMQTYAQAASAKSTGILVADRWQHVAATYDGTTVTYYIDGIAAGTATFSNTPNTTLNVYEIGRTVWASGRAYVGGIINEVIVYSSALSLVQVQALAAAGPPSKASKLTGDNSTFESGVGSWTTYYPAGGNVSGRNTTTPISGTADYYWDGDNSNTVTATYNSSTGLSGFLVGQRYRMEFDVKHSGSGVSGKIGAATGFTGWDYGYFEISASMTTATHGFIDFTATGTTVHFSMGYTSAGTMNNVYADNIKVYVLDGAPLPPDPRTLSTSGNIAAYWRNDGSYAWRNLGPKTIKNFTSVATDPINDSNSIGGWTHNGNSLTSVTGGREGFIDGAQRIAPRYRLLFDSGTNHTANSTVAVTEGKTYKVSAYFMAGTVSAAMLRVDGPGLSTPVSIGVFGTVTTYWTNKTATFTATATANVTIELHNRATGTQFFDDVTLVESGPASDGTVSGSPTSLLFQQGYNGSKNVNTGRDTQGFPLLTKNVGEMGFGGSGYGVAANYVRISDLPALTAKTVAFWVQVGAGVFEGASDNVVVGWGSGWTGLDIVDDGGTAPWETASLRFHNSAGSNPGAARVRWLERDQWYYLAYTEDGTTNKYYQNGRFMTSTTSGGATVSATTIALGARTAATYYPYSGAVSGLQLYNRALSESELLQNYNAQKSRFT